MSDRKYWVEAVASERQVFIGNQRFYGASDIGARMLYEEWRILGTPDLPEWLKTEEAK